MSNIRSSLKVITKNKKIERDINKAIIQKMGSRFNSIARRLTISLKKQLDLSIRSAPEYNDILYGNLRTELGVIDPQTDLERMISVIVSGVHVHSEKLRIVSGKVFGKIKIEAVLSDFSDVFNSGIGEYVTARGETIPWLKWILAEGDKVIIRDFGVSFGFPEISRTGDAIMRASSKGWSVPSQYSGTIENNFITRSINSSMDNIEQEMKKIFESGLK